MNWLTPLALALLLLLGLRLSRTPLRGKGWQLLRVLLPSWRFFEDIELGPELWVRVRQRKTEWSEWQLALRPPERGPGALLLSAETTATLARKLWGGRWGGGLGGLGLLDAPALVSYRLVQAVAERRARALAGASGAAFQFCLSEGAPSDAGFVSQEHEL